MDSVSEASPKVVAAFNRAAYQAMVTASMGYNRELYAQVHDIQQEEYSDDWCGTVTDMNNEKWGKIMMQKVQQNTDDDHDDSFDEEDQCGKVSNMDNEKWGKMMIEKVQQAERLKMTRDCPGEEDFLEDFSGSNSNFNNTSMMDQDIRNHEGRDIAESDCGKSDHSSDEETDTYNNETDGFQISGKNGTDSSGMIKHKHLKNFGNPVSEILIPDKDSENIEIESEAKHNSTHKKEDIKNLHSTCKTLGIPIESEDKEEVDIDYDSDSETVKLKPDKLTEKFENNKTNESVIQTGKMNTNTDEISANTEMINAYETDNSDSEKSDHSKAETDIEHDDESPIDLEKLGRALKMHAEETDVQVKLEYVGDVSDSGLQEYGLKGLAEFPVPVSGKKGPISTEPWSRAMQGWFCPNDGVVLGTKKVVGLVAGGMS